MAEAEIDACIQEMKAAWLSGDIDRMMAMYADDCSFATNEGDIRKGKGKIRQNLVDFVAKYATCDFGPVDRMICGNCCNEMGTFTCKQKGSGTVDKGKYLAGYVKRDGKWLVRFDCSIFG